MADDEFEIEDLFDDLDEQSRATSGRFASDEVTTDPETSPTPTDAPSVDDLFDDFDDMVAKKHQTEGGVPTSTTPDSALAASEATREAEFMGEAGLAVTGQSRLEAAFGSGEGDDTAVAQVAQVASETSVGTIFHQVYRPWNGKLNTRWVRNWAILRYHIYGLFSKGHKPWPVITKLVLFGVLITSLGDLVLLAVGAASGTEEISRLAGISRGNLYGHVLSFWFRNACTYPIVTALIIGGIISEDRRNGTSALYFSRPVNRRDYAAMKYLSVATILGVVVLFTLFAYYVGAILVNGEGWAYLIDTGLLFLGAFAAGTILVITYTSIGVALSSISQGKFFPAVSFLGLILGTKMVAFLIFWLFDSSAIYLISPYDNVAHVGQWMLGLNYTYEHPASWSLVMLLVINAVSLYILSARVSSLEVTRE